ncbi:MAG: transposase [Actinomycetes bacterium]
MICADELGPVIPRSFPPAPAWTTDGHRVKAPLDYGRGPEKTWVYGALRVTDGRTVTLTAPSRNSIGYQQLLAAVETANPAGTIMVITDNLSSHTSLSTRTWLADHPRIQHTFIPKGGLLAESAGGLVAAVSPRGLCRPVVCHSRGDHAGHQDGDLSAQCPRPTVGVGPPSAVPTPPTPHLHLPHLRNAALGGWCSLTCCSSSAC